MNLNDVTYIFTKITSVIVLKIIRKKMIFSNMHLINRKPKNFRKVLFYFPDSRYMHLGDHLFFEPLVRLLKVNGMQVYIAPAKPMMEYFEGLGYDIAKEGIFGYDLIISKPDFVKKLLQSDNVLLIETAYSKISKPLIDDMSEKLSSFLNLKRLVDTRPKFYHKHLRFSNMQLEDRSQYVIFNSYLNSGSFRVDKKKYRVLNDFARGFKAANPGYKIIQTGSLAEKLADKRNYEFVDIDLRGETTVLDLFQLSNQTNVVAYIGFDGFIMHLFFILKKDTYVMSRGRWSKRSRFFLENYIDPPFSQNDTKKIYIR